MVLMTKVMCVCVCEEKRNIASVWIILKARKGKDLDTGLVGPVSLSVIAMTHLTVLRLYVSLNYRDITITHKPFQEGRISFDIAECHRIDIIGVIFSLGQDL